MFLRKKQVDQTASDSPFQHLDSAEIAKRIEERLKAVSNDPEVFNTETRATQSKSETGEGSGEGTETETEAKPEIKENQLGTPDKDGNQIQYDVGQKVKYKGKDKLHEKQRSNWIFRIEDIDENGLATIRRVPGDDQNKVHVFGDRLTVVPLDVLFPVGKPTRINLQQQQKAGEGVGTTETEQKTEATEEIKQEGSESEGEVLTNKSGTEFRVGDTGKIQR